jgi:hypothetical protein
MRAGARDKHLVASGYPLGRDHSPASLSSCVHSDSERRRMVLPFSIVHVPSRRGWRLAVVAGEPWARIPGVLGVVKNGGSIVFR